MTVKGVCHVCGGILPVRLYTCGHKTTVQIEMTLPSSRWEGRERFVKVTILFPWLLVGREGTVVVLVTCCYICLTFGKLVTNMRFDSAILTRKDSTIMVCLMGVFP